MLILPLRGFATDVEEFLANIKSTYIDYDGAIVDEDTITIRFRSDSALTSQIVSEITELYNSLSSGIEELKIAKKNKIKEIKDIRDSVLLSGFVWNGNAFPAHTPERSADFLDSLKLNSTQDVTWRSMDNTSITMTRSEFLVFSASLTLWNSTVQSTADELISLVNMATTMSSINILDTSTLYTVPYTSISSTYPSAGTYGSTTNIPQIVVDDLGQITSIGSVEVLSGVGTAGQLANWTTDSTLSGLTLGTGISVTNGTLSVVPIDGNDKFNSTQSSTGISTTTSTSYQTKIGWTTPVLVAGTYAIGWYYEWYYNNTGRSFNAKITMDGSDVAVHTQEPHDSSTLQRHPASGRIIRNLSAGTHVINLQWKSSNTGDTAGIVNAHLQLQLIG